MKTMSKVLFTFISSFICYSVFAQKSIQLSVDRVYDAEEKSDEAVKNSILANSQIFQIDENHRLEREGEETILYKRSGSKKLKREQGGQQVCRINNLVLEGLVNSEEEILLVTLDKQENKLSLEKYDKDLNQVANIDLTEMGLKMVYHFYELSNGNIFITAKVTDTNCTDAKYSAMVLDKNGSLLHSSCIEKMNLIRKLKPNPFPVIEFNKQIIIPASFNGKEMGTQLLSFSMDLWQTTEIEIPTKDSENFIASNNKLSVEAKSKIYELSEFSEMNNNLFQVYPSPTNKELNITSTEEEELYIYSVSGVILKSIIIENGEGKVDISSLVDGLYFIGNSVNSKMQRFIKM